VLQLFLSITAVVILSAGLVAGFFGHLWVMVIALFGFVGCLIAANLDRISEFKASKSGVEAKTREIVVRAENTLRELQLLAVKVTELSLSLVKRNGRFGGYSDEEQEFIKNDLLSVLRELKVSEADIQRTLLDWHRFVEFDYALYILGGSIVPSKLDPDTQRAWGALQHRASKTFHPQKRLRNFSRNLDSCPRRKENSLPTIPIIAPIELIGVRPRGQSATPGGL
jgi:hypothetical protein